MIFSVLFNLIFLFLVSKYLLDIILVVWCNAIYGVPYVPTKTSLIRQTVRLLNPKPKAKIIELGSGDGRVLVEFAKKYPVEAVGYEKNKLLLWIARQRARMAWNKKGKVKFVEGDLFKVSLSDADVVYIYLLPWMIEKLRPKFEKELKKGSRVVSFDYPLKSDKFEMVKVIGKGKQKMAVYCKL